MVRPYSKSRHTSASAVSKRLRTLSSSKERMKIYEVILDTGSSGGTQSELIRSTSVTNAARKSAAIHRITLGPVVITADRPIDRTGYRVTFHGGMFGGDKDSVMFVSLARIQ